MFFNLFKKESKKSDLLNEVYGQIKELYNFNSISEERKILLNNITKANGFLPYSHIKALNELTNAEVLFALEKKWENEGIFSDGIFNFDNEKISPLARHNIKNSDWIKKEQHNIKLINLAGLGNGNKTQEPGKFIDWLRQLLILPTGNLNNGIYNTTIYLIPFHPLI